MNKPKHTPLPWHYQEKSDAYTHIIRGPNNRMIVQFPQDTSGQAEANARFICEAVNSYETLREAVFTAKSILWMAKEYASGGGSHSIEMQGYLEAEKLIDAAIATQAEGEPLTDEEEAAFQVGG